MNKIGKATLILFLLTCCSCYRKLPSSSSSFSSESESTTSETNSQDSLSQSSSLIGSSEQLSTSSSSNTSSSISSNNSSSDNPSSEAITSSSREVISSESSSEDYSSISSSDDSSSILSSEEISSVDSSENTSSDNSSEDYSSESSSEIISSSEESSSEDPIKEDMSFIDYISDGTYDEINDDNGGIDKSDLSKLIEYFNNFNASSYVVDSKNYLSSQAISKYNQIYKKEYTSNVRAIVSNQYRYFFNQDLTINDAFVDYQNNIAYTKLIGEEIKDKLNSNIDNSNLSIYLENNSCNEHFFSLEDINSSYIDQYGPYQEEINSSLSITYQGWEKVSENKYRCDRKEVINDFLGLISYDYQNDGLFMTYDHLTLELNVSEEISLRIRVYASSTQSGKLISSHINEEYTNWYLLAHEAIIYNLNNAYVNAIEDFLNR